MHDESRDGLRIRFVNRADIDWAPLERSYRDDRMKKIFGAFLDEVKPGGRPLPAPRRPRRRVPRGRRGARDQVRDDAPRLLGDVPDGPARLLHGLPDLRSDQVREVRAVRVRQPAGRIPATSGRPTPARAGRRSSTGSSRSSTSASRRRPGFFARRPRALVWAARSRRSARSRATSSATADRGSLRAAVEQSVRRAASRT